MKKQEKKEKKKAIKAKARSSPGSLRRRSEEEAFTHSIPEHHRLPSFGPGAGAAGSNDGYDFQALSGPRAFRPQARPTAHAGGASSNPVVVEDDKWTNAMHKLREAAGIPGGSINGEPPGNGEEGIEEWAVWLSAKMTMVQLDNLCRGNDVACRFESKKAKTVRLIRWAAE